MGTRIEGIAARFDAVDKRFDGMQSLMKVRFDDAGKSLDYRFEGLKEQFEVRLGGLEKQFESHAADMEKQMAHLEKSLLSAFAQSQMRTEITGAQAIVDIRERVAVLESQRA